MYQTLLAILRTDQYPVYKSHRADHRITADRSLPVFMEISLYILHNSYRIRWALRYVPDKKCTGKPIITVSLCYIQMSEYIPGFPVLSSLRYRLTVHPHHYHWKHSRQLCSASINALYLPPASSSVWFRTEPIFAIISSVYVIALRRILLASCVAESRIS